MTPRISICTPVLDRPEFIQEFAAATIEAEVVIVDTGSTPENRKRWMEVGKLIDYPTPGHNYGHWCNAGYQHCTGDIIIFLNNDVRAVGPWLEEVTASVEAGSIYGPELLAQIISGLRIPFLSGWCIAATRGTWDAVHMHVLNRLHDRAPDDAYTAGPWDTTNYPAAGYWEDNQLSFDAVMAGIELRQVKWPIEHLDNGNGTSKHRKEYYADVARNRATFEGAVREAMRPKQLSTEEREALAQRIGDIGLSDAVLQERREGW